jgi:hypothetical protein
MFAYNAPVFYEHKIQCFTKYLIIYNKTYYKKLHFTKHRHPHTNILHMHTHVHMRVWQ